MNRHLGLTALTSALMVAMLAAQDEPPRAKKDDGVEKKADPKKDRDDPPVIKELEKKERTPAGDNDPERVKKIIERLNKNMDSSEERLNKKDPGDDTRKIQHDIIKDLDELIKQQNEGGGGGGAASMSMSKSSKGGSASNSAKSSSRSKSSQGKQDSQANKNNKGGDAKKGDPSTAQGDKKKDGQDKLDKGADKEKTAKNEGKEGKDGGGKGGDPKAKDNKDKNTIADLFKDVWGHLPLSKRQEMDAYAKERFLPKYDEILRQYYRTISEQGRRKDGE